MSRSELQALNLELERDLASRAVDGALLQVYFRTREALQDVFEYSSEGRRGTAIELTDRGHAG